VAGVRQIVPSNPTSREKRQAARALEVGSGVQESQSAPFDESEFLSLAAHTHMPYIFSFPILAIIIIIIIICHHGQTFVSTWVL
jgi:hypothetical protein